MLSRTADALYWLNRYAERADSILRIAKINYILSFDQQVSGLMDWKPALKLFTPLGDKDINEVADNSSRVLFHLFYDLNNTNALKVITAKARDNARSVQDHLSKEIWGQVNQMYHFINKKETAEAITGHEPLPALDRMITDSVLLCGTQEMTMPRGEGWCFMNLGKCFERAMISLNLFDIYYAFNDYNLSERKDILYWRSLLLSISGYELFLKQYSQGNLNRRIMEQILFSEQFTHAVVYNLLHCFDYVRSIINMNKNTSKEAQTLQKQVGALKSKLQFTEEDLLDSERLQKLICQLRQDLFRVSGMISEVFFSG